MDPLCGMTRRSKPRPAVGDMLAASGCSPGGATPTPFPTTGRSSVVDVRHRRRRHNAAFVILSMLLVAACGSSAASGIGFRASGDPLPLPAAGSLSDVSGDQFERMLVGQLGRVVVVNVWASWCVPCRTEAPLLERASRTYRNVAFLGVDSKDGRVGAARFIAEFGISYPNVVDASGEIRDRLGLRGFPTTYIFGTDGELRASVVGGISEQRLAAQIQDAQRR